MSTHVVTAPMEQLRLLCVEYLREPVSYPMTDGVVSWVFEPDLTPDELMRFTRLHQIAAADLRLSPDEFEAIRPSVQTLRDLRQMGRNAFMALTAAERDRLMYDAFTATTQVLLSILRDDQ